MDFITTNADLVAYEIRMDYDNPLTMNTHLFPWNKKT